MTPGVIRVAEEEGMGQININAWGSMAPLADGVAKVYDISHTGSYAETVDAARRALNDIEDALRRRLGDEKYEAADSWAPVAPALTSDDLARGGGLSAV
jgi:hypothetical protein